MQSPEQLESALGRLGFSQEEIDKMKSKYSGVFVEDEDEEEYDDEDEYLEDTETDKKGKRVKEQIIELSLEDLITQALAGLQGGVGIPQSKNINNKSFQSLQSQTKATVGKTGLSGHAKDGIRNTLNNRFGVSLQWLLVFV